MVEFPPTTLVLTKGKLYVNCTVPKGLRSYFSGRNQIRKSTGTTGMALAERRKHDLSQKIYDEFDEAKSELRSDAFEALREGIGLAFDPASPYVTADKISAADLVALEALYERALYPAYTGQEEEDAALEDTSDYVEGLLDAYMDAVEVDSGSITSSAGSGSSGAGANPSSVGTPLWGSQGFS
jgi:Domain of unknown function (DUF6538)